MKTAQLNKVVRQKDEDLKRAVILMANGRIIEGVEALRRQGRVQEVTHRAERFAAIAKAYVESPENTLVVSPDNKSRQEINSAIRDELNGKVDSQASNNFRCLSGRTCMWKTAVTLTHIGQATRYDSTQTCRASMLRLDK